MGAVLVVVAIMAILSLLPLWVVATRRPTNRQLYMSPEWVARHVR